MMRSYPKLVAVAVTAALAVACARDAPPPPSSPPPYRDQAARRPAAPAPSASAYVSAAAAIDLFEIRSSELALQRSSRRNVHDFATMMVSAHKGTSAQLSFAGRRLNLLPSAMLDPRHQAMFDALQSAANFDAVYRQQQLAVHQEALVLHRSYAARGGSPTLRPVAAAMVPIIERHLRLVRYL